MSHAPVQRVSGDASTCTGARLQAQPVARQPQAVGAAAVASRRCAHTFPDGRQCVREASAGEMACSVHR